MNTNAKNCTGVSWVMLCASMGVLPACGPDATGSSDELNPRPDDVGVVEQPLFELACWTQAGASATISVNNEQTNYSVSSPNGSYGQSSCPNQYVVDVNNVAGRSFEVLARPTAQWTTPAQFCPGFWEKTRVWGWKPGTGWQAVDYWEEVGQWVSPWPFGFGLPYCGDSITAGSAPRSHPANHGFSSLRVVTQGGFTTTYQPVTVTVYMD